MNKIAAVVLVILGLLVVIGAIGYVNRQNNSDANTQLEQSLTPTDYIFSTSSPTLDTSVTPDTFLPSPVPVASPS